MASKVQQVCYTIKYYIINVGEVSGSVLTGKCEVIPPATRKFRTGQPVTVHRFMGKPD